MRNNAKILIIGPNAEGGISSVINLFEQYGLFDEKIIRLTSYSGGNTIKRLSVFALFLVHYLWLLLTNKNIKLIHLQSAADGSFYRKFLALKIAKFFRKKVIFNIHPIWFIVFYNKSNNLIKKMITGLLDQSDLILVLSDNIKSEILNICQNSNIQVLYNPVAIKAFNHISSDKIRVVFMGNLTKDKGVYDIIEAAKYIKNSNVIINLYGKGNFDEFNKLISDSQVEEIVKIKGWIGSDEKDIALENSDISILPSYTEGLPMSILEPMAAGLPIISTPVGGIPEAVEDNVNGFLIKSGDYKALAEKIDLLANDKDLREKMGQESLRIAKEKFDINVVINHLKEIYEELIKK